MHVTTLRLAPRTTHQSGSRRSKKKASSRMLPHPAEEELVLDIVEAADGPELVFELDNDRADECVGPAADDPHQGSEQVSSQTDGAVLSLRPVSEGPATAIADTEAPCRTRNRSVPPPPPFDPTLLPDNALHDPQRIGRLAAPCTFHAVGLAVATSRSRSSHGSWSPGCRAIGSVMLKFGCLQIGPEKAASPHFDHRDRHLDPGSGSARSANGGQQ